MKKLKAKKYQDGGDVSPNVPDWSKRFLDSTTNVFFNKYAGSSPDSIYATKKMWEYLGKPGIAVNDSSTNTPSEYYSDMNAMDLYKFKNGKINYGEGSWIGNFLSEGAHAYEHNVENKDSLKRQSAITDSVNNHDKTYNVKGSIESDAHKVIQPKLKKDYDANLRWAKEHPYLAAAKMKFLGNEQKRQSGGIINRTGYLKGAKTNSNPYNVIPSGHITTTGMKFPIFANGKLLMPDTGDYKFNTNSVLETPAFNKGGQMRKPKGLKKYSNSALKMQAGGLTPMNFIPQGVNLGTSLLAPNPAYQGTENPGLNLASAGNDAIAGGKLGANFGPLGAGVGAAVGGAAGLIKSTIDFNQDKKQWGQNLKTARAENKNDYDATHKPYGTRGYMQGTPNEQVYSLFDGGKLPTKKEMINTQTAITDSYTNGTISLSKQDGGKIPTDLNELFDRAMDESGGDEKKAEALVQQYQEHPEMMQNKGKKKPQLKKKKAV